MAEPVTMVLKVDLQCSRCYEKVKKVLSKFPQIRDQTYNEKQNTVTIKVVCCNPEKLRDKICRKGCGSIKSIEIKPPGKKKEPEQKKIEPEQKKKEPEKKEEKQDEKKPDKPPPPPEKTEPEPVRIVPVHNEPVTTFPPTGYPYPGGGCCGPCSEGRAGGPCFQGHGRPAGLGPCLCGCGGMGRPDPCSCGCGGMRRPGPCSCGCGGMGRPGPCSCGCGGMGRPGPCSCGCGGMERPIYDSYGGRRGYYVCHCDYVFQENPSGCGVM